MTAVVLLLTALVLGYVVGRVRPLHRASDWANWQTYGRLVRRGPRWWAVWTVLSAENIAWLIAHPVRGWRAWQHRNDPPAPRSPAVQVPGPPHNGLPCFGPTGDWLCARPGGDGHSDHFPYRAGQTEDGPS